MKKSNATFNWDDFKSYTCLNSCDTTIQDDEIPTLVYDSDSDSDSDDEEIPKKSPKVSSYDNAWKILKKIACLNQELLIGVNYTDLNPTCNQNTKVVSIPGTDEGKFKNSQTCKP